MAFLNIQNPTLIHSLSVAAGFVIITFLHVTFGELAPKNLSIRGAESTVLMLALPMRLFHILFLPAVKVLNFAARVILWGMGASKLHESAAHSTEELKLLISQSKDDGQLDDAEERLLNNIFNLDRRTARDIMVHRTKVISIPLEATVREAVECARRSGHTRFPLYKDKKDEPVGFIHTKDLLLYPEAETVKSLRRDALNIYDHMNSDDILEMMRQGKNRLGLVWDEYGSWQGLLTMEDVLETIVGEIQDEYDEEEPPVQDLQNGAFLVQTTVSLEELKQFIPLTLGPDSEEHYRPLAAILVSKFGDSPTKGDSWSDYGAIFEIDSLDGLAVNKVKVRLLPEENANESVAERKKEPDRKSDERKNDERKNEERQNGD
jgi:CBS domain containing-hemolysin-like protein